MGNKKADQLFNDIESIAAEPTDRKSPTSIPQSVPLQGNSNPAVAPAPLAPTFFGGDEKKEEPKIAEPQISQKAIEASGKTGAFLISGSIETVFSFAERIVYINRFSKSEKSRLIVLDEIPLAQQTVDDQNLNRKFLSITKKHDKIREKIPLDEKEVEALEAACAEYTRLTGKSLNPQLIIWSTIAKIFIGRSMDIFL